MLGLTRVGHNPGVAFGGREAELRDEAAVTAMLEPAGPGLGPAPLLSARSRRVAYWAMGAALVLHIAIIIICIIDWASLLDLALTKAEVPDAIPVSLIYEPPPPPPKPQVQPEPPQPPIPPRMSGPDEKTEAKLEDTPQPALPQPKSPPPEPALQMRKPAPTRAGNREPAAVSPSSSAEREAAPAPAPETRKQAPPAPLFHSIRLPSQHGGAGERDTAGDPYLNHLLQIVAGNRIYPPASEFPGSAERTVVYAMLVAPDGRLVQITLEDPSGSTIADEAAGNMLRKSAPFPPLPADWPHFPTSIIIEMTMYPNPR